ncbi:hypothetical protein [Thermococcus sp.]|uniref:hypothetical protein n=1 Tax=Thermococcus sp. TaxID=35749 RepID=UPI00260A32C6|nr:hypothetical protein [Thermococcus sp.]
MLKKVAPLVLVLVVFSAGCLIHVERETTAPGFSLNVTYAPFKAPVNVTALTVNISANFIGYRHIVVNYSYPVILIKAGPGVRNVSAFRLSKDVYLVPYYTFNNTEGMTSVTLQLENGSMTFANIKVFGTPAKVVDITVNYEVEKNGTHHIVRPLGWSVNTLRLWNETFNATVELGEPIQIANAPRVEFKNGTYVLPTVCKSTDGGLTVIYRYSVASVYIVGPAGDGFVGKVYFPCEETTG